MKKIIIACAGGMSSSLLVQKIVKAAEDVGLKAEMDIVQTLSSFTRFDDSVDIAFLVTGTHAFNKVTFENFNEKIDFIMVAPQVRYLINDVKKMIDSLNLEIPVEQIHSIDYGRQNGKAVLDVILNEIG